MRKVGLIGCGAIGTLIAKAVEDRIVRCEELILYDYNFERAEHLQKCVRTKTRIVRSVEEMIKIKPVVIVEAASQQAVHEYLRLVLAEDIELIVMSVGALLDMHVRSNRIHTPSGAIGGLDAISSAALAGIEEITLTTRKNPQALKMDNRGVTVVYEGDAEMAVRLFPKEMNVAAALALASRPEKVKVRVISDPEVSRNVHEVSVAWKHGHMDLTFENDPHPDNPGTSALAAWSAVKLLKDLLEKRI